LANVVSNVYEKLMLESYGLALQQTYAMYPNHSTWEKSRMSTTWLMSSFCRIITFITRGIVLSHFTCCYLARIITFITRGIVLCNFTRSSLAQEIEKTCVEYVFIALPLSGRACDCTWLLDLWLASNMLQSFDHASTASY
jgi:hypothetical protein